MDHRPRYCKAFTESELAGFAPFAAARASAASGGASAAAPILYLHRDLRVRTGAFDDDPVLFETDDPAWARFCSQELSFPPAWIADLAAPGSAASE